MLDILKKFLFENETHNNLSEFQDFICRVDFIKDEEESYVWSEDVYIIEMKMTHLFRGHNIYLSFDNWSVEAWDGPFFPTIFFQHHCWIDSDIEREKEKIIIKIKDKFPQDYEMLIKLYKFGLFLGENYKEIYSLFMKEIVTTDKTK